MRPRWAGKRRLLARNQRFTNLGYITALTLACSSSQPPAAWTFTVDTVRSQLDGTTKLENQQLLLFADKVSFNVRCSEVVPWVVSGVIEDGNDSKPIRYKLDSKE